MAGTLHLKLKVYKDERGRYSLKGKKEWELATKAPRYERVAQTLSDALNLLNLKPYQSDLPKLVSIRLETEVRGVNNYETFHVWFVDINDYEIRAHVPNNPVFKTVWSVPGVQRYIKTLANIKGENK